MPFVSVIVPAYNAQETIGETLESIFNQTLADFELIVVNDGSTDQTLKIVAGFDDSRLKAFSYPNAGVAASRNRGAAQASSAYLSFIDADDLWTPDKLEAQLNALENTPQAAVAYSWTNYIDQTGRFVARAQRTTFDGDVYAELLMRDFLESASNVTIRRQAFIDSGGFDESLSGAADWDLFLRLAARYSFVAVPRLGVLYRLGGNSMSANLSMQEQECLQVLERAYEQASESLQPLKKHSFAHLYQYLGFKVMQGQLSREKGLSALRYFKRVLNYNPWLLGQQPCVILAVSLKILAALLLPIQSQQFINVFRLIRAETQLKKPLTARNKTTEIHSH